MKNTCFLSQTRAWWYLCLPKMISCASRSCTGYGYSDPEYQPSAVPRTYSAHSFTPVNSSFNGSQHLWRRVEWCVVCTRDKSSFHSLALFSCIMCHSSLVRLSTQKGLSSRSTRGSRVRCRSFHVIANLAVFSFSMMAFLTTATCRFLPLTVPERHGTQARSYDMANWQHAHRETVPKRHLPFGVAFNPV